MNLEYKKLEAKTLQVMKDTITSQEDYSENVTKKILNLTGHKTCKIVNSGNSSILLAMSNIPGDILIPDQGGWHGFKQAARFLNKKIISIPTEYGLIKPEHLEDLDIKEDSGLFLTSFAGYTAEQDIKNISKITQDKNILLIEDASGGIGDPSKKLANGKYSDIIVCSTGSPKIINVGNGGFITTKIPGLFDNSNFLNKTLKATKETISGINNEIEYTESNFTKTVNACTYIKNELEEYVIHHDKRGINVIIKHNNKDNIRNLKNRLKINNKSIITICPNYNRLKIKGFALEIKNMNPNTLNETNLDNIIHIIKNNLKA